MERETGIEPATFSLGNRPSIENKEYSVSEHLVLAIGRAPRIPNKRHNVLGRVFVLLGLASIFLFAFLDQ
jgi:hypothetical protein